MRNDDLFRVVLVQIKEVRRMSRCYNLYGTAFVSIIFWVTQPVHCISYFAQQPRMNPALWLFKAHNSWRIRKVCQREERQGKQCPVRKIVGFNFMLTYICPQQKRLLTICRSFEQNTVKLWQPPS